MDWGARKQHLAHVCLRFSPEGMDSPHFGVASFMVNITCSHAVLVVCAGHLHRDVLQALLIGSWLDYIRVVRAGSEQSSIMFTLR